MKKLICLFLALVMMTSLWACTNAPENQDDSQETPGSSEPSTEVPTELENPTEPSTEAPTKSTEPSVDLPTDPQRVSVENQVDYTPEEPVTANVTDAVNIQYKDKYGNSGSLKLPKIELPGPNIEAINAEILSDYSDFARSEDDSREMNYSDVYYRWGIHGDILSVVIIGGGSAFDGGWEDHGGCDLFSLYNISISKCRLVSNEEVYAASGMENVKTRVLHAITSFGGEWRGKDADAIEVFFNSPEGGINLECFAEEISDANFEKAIPFFNEDGVLCVMGYITTFIGSGGFWGIIRVDDYYTDALSTAEEYYQYYYELYH